MNIEIALKLLELFTLIFVGYFLVASKMLKKEATKHFSSLIFYLTLPALILNSMAGGTDVPNEDVLIVVLISLTIHGLLAALAVVLLSY